MFTKNTMTLETFILRKEILELLRNGMTSRELSDNIKLPVSTINFHLGAMIEDGSLKKSGKKVYRGISSTLFKSILDNYELCGRTLVTKGDNLPVEPIPHSAVVYKLSETTLWTPKTPPLTGLYKRVSIGSTFGMV